MTIAVPPKAQSRKRTRNEIKPLSGLDVNALLNKDMGKSPSKKKRTVQITHQNPIPEFRQALDVTTSVAEVHEATRGFGVIIEEQIRDSFGDVNYARAVEELGVMRSEMIDLEEPGVFNDFVRELKQKLLGGELGGERRDMWREVRRARLGLIERKVSGVSDVGEEEAEEVSRGQLFPSVSSLIPASNFSIWLSLLSVLIAIYPVRR